MPEPEFLCSFQFSRGLEGPVGFLAATRCTWTRASLNASPVVSNSSSPSQERSGWKFRVRSGWSIAGDWPALYLFRGLAYLLVLALLSVVVELREAAEVVPDVPVLVSVPSDEFLFGGSPAVSK